MGQSPQTPSQGRLQVAQVGQLSGPARTASPPVVSCVVRQSIAALHRAGLTPTRLESLTGTRFTPCRRPTRRRAPANVAQCALLFVGLDITGAGSIRLHRVPV